MMYDIYSKRQRRQRGEVPDVFQYDHLPVDLKKQITMLIQETLGNYESSNSFMAHQVYAFILGTIAKEWARPELELDKYERYPDRKLLDAFMEEKDLERSLDIIEMAFHCANIQVANPEYYGRTDGRAHVDSCIEELNARFKEHGVGFSFVNNEIIRVDSDVLHNEVVKPAIHFLSVPGFEGPQEEFFAAHDHYRHGFYKEALNEANKAFESTMKVICDQKGWDYKKGDTAKKLITVCMDNGLFPSYYQSHLSALANLLEGGVPTIRNNEGGHGQGGVVKTIDPHIVSYTLHMAASAIVLLVNSASSLS